MTALSCRSLLSGLLSSAAVIAAGPVARVIPPEASPDIFSLLDVEFLEGLSQSVHSTVFYAWNPSAIDGDWRYVARIATLGANVLDCGEPPAASWKTLWGADA